MCVSLTRVVVRTRGRECHRRCGGEGSCVGAEGEYDSGVARPAMCALGLCVLHAFGVVCVFGCAFGCCSGLVASGLRWCCGFGCVVMGVRRVWCVWGLGVACTRVYGVSLFVCADRDRECSVRAREMCVRVRESECVFL